MSEFVWQNSWAEGLEGGHFCGPEEFPIHAEKFLQIDFSLGQKWGASNLKNVSSFIEASNILPPLCNIVFRGEIRNRYR